MNRAAIPPRGRDADTLLEQMKELRGGDIDWRGGRTWSLVYHAGDAHTAFLKQAHNLYFEENALNPFAFRSLHRMASEVVQMTADMLNAPPEAAGTMTSGGTESIILVVKAARDRARKRRPRLRQLEMVLPRTAHCAFEKAGHYLGMRPRYVPVGDDFRARVSEVARATSRRTALIVGSAPQYPHGVIDPIEDLGELAARRGVPLHVDACFGGFLLPWLERLGHDLPRWDFRVPGVTSISADVHKYGYAPKGASVVVYRSMDLLRHQFFVSTRWPGGVYASPAVGGSRPGGSIAAAWASLQRLGADGMTALASRAWDAAERLRAGIRAIPGLRLLGASHATIVTWASSEPEVDVYAVAERLAALGWGVDRQQDPPCVHCTVNASNAPAVDPYLADLHQAVADVRADPSLARQGDAAMYGMMARVPIRGLVDHTVRGVLEGMYGPDGASLDDPGQGAQEGPLLRALNRHGHRVQPLLDGVDSLRGRVDTLRGHLHARRGGRR